MLAALDVDAFRRRVLDNHLGRAEALHKAMGEEMHKYFESLEVRWQRGVLIDSCSESVGFVWGLFVVTRNGFPSWLSMLVTAPTVRRIH